MQASVRMSLMLLAGCGLLATSTIAANARGAVLTAEPAAASLPDAPNPDAETALAAQSSSTSSSSSSSGSQSSSTQSRGSSPPPATQPSSAQETQHQKAEEQLKEQEQQRVAGVMATFNTTRNPDAVALSPGQKYRLFFRSAFDPWPFGLNVIVAGIDQATDADPEWGQGMQGYAKRYGAAYSDYFIGNFFGNAMLPSLLHEDPRYFQKDSGSSMGRFLWAAASTVWCRRDSGRWGPNYANVGGNLIGAAIARTYYPASERTVADTVSDGLTVSAEGIAGAEVIEFWPDIVRRHQRKLAEKQARAMDAAEQQKAKEKPSQN